MTEEQAVKREILIVLRNSCSMNRLLREGIIRKRFIYCRIYDDYEKYPSKEEFEEVFQQMIEEGLIKNIERGAALTFAGKKVLEEIKKENTVTFKEALVNLLTGKWERIKSNYWGYEDGDGDSIYYTLSEDGFTIVDEKGNRASNHIDIDDLGLKGFLEHTGKGIYR